MRWLGRLRLGLRRRVCRLIGRVVNVVLELNVRNWLRQRRSGLRRHVRLGGLWLRRLRGYKWLSWLWLRLWLLHKVLDFDVRLGRPRLRLRGLRLRRLRWHVRLGGFRLRLRRCRLRWHVRLCGHRLGLRRSRLRRYVRLGGLRLGLCGLRLRWLRRYVRLSRLWLRLLLLHKVL